MRQSGYSANPLLDPQASAQLRDRLVADIGHLADSEVAALWAHRNLTQKNSLTAEDAQSVEASFASRLASLTVSSDENGQPHGEVQDAAVRAP